jgi:acetyl esterase/lipase
MLQRPWVPAGRAVRSATLALVTAGLLAAVSLAGVARPAATAEAAAQAVRAATASQSCPSTPYGDTVSLETYGSPANGQPLDLDEYITSDTQSNVPGVILIHGGGWAKGNFTTKGGDSLASIGNCLADNGYDAFSVDYALTLGSTEGSFPENLQDINEAIGWVKAHVSNLDTAKILVLGTSAGGNLADLAGENAMGYQDGLLGVITQSGPADLTAAGMGCSSSADCQSGSPGNTIEKYLGCYDSSSATCTLYFQNGTTEQVPAATAYADASPASTVSLSRTVPAPPYLIANSGDEAIPLAQATDLDQQLNKQCKATSAATSDQLAVLPGDQHAETYSDILAGPTLDFVSAVAAGTVPATCTTASPLTGAAMAYDATSSARSVIMFGGCCTSSGTVVAQTESYDTATGTWTPVRITGPSPVPRIGAAFGWDPTSGDLVLFGGEYLPGGSAQPVALNDTWELSYTVSTGAWTWTQVDDAGSPGCLSDCPGAPLARYGASADQAPHNMGLALFGGENDLTATQSGARTAFGDTWLWADGAWTQLSPAENPAGGLDPRYGATLVYDGAHNSDLLFGGDDPVSSCDESCLNLVTGTWKLTYDTTTSAWTWTQLSPTTSPGPREFAAGASATNDSVGGAVLFGGLSGSTPSNGGINAEQLQGDTWTWNGSQWAQPCASSCGPPPSFGAGIAYQRADVEDVLFGGYAQTAPAAPATTWIWSGSTWSAG